MKQHEQVLDFIEHLSEKPWSDYTKADYSIEQWHAACLIHQHSGAPTSKDQCKLPVKTPNGAVNRNGVHAAAAALAGARGGVHASSDEKSKAASALVRYYHSMDEDPPPSLMKHSDVEAFIESLPNLDHSGVKGMRWGVRKAPVKTSSDYKKTAPLRKKKSRELSNKQLQQLNARMELERKHAQFNPSSFTKGHAAVKSMLAVGATASAVYAFAHSPLGKHAASFVKTAAKNASRARRMKTGGKWTWVDRTPLAIEAASRIVG